MPATRMKIALLKIEIDRLDTRIRCKIPGILVLAAAQ
jgi:hypothetical protein